MTYQPPALLIEQELVSVPAANSLPLHACILAPRYGLHRYGVEGEEALLGAYDDTSGNSFTAWPDKAADGVVDVSSAILKVKDAVLQYFNDAVTGDGGTAPIGLLEDNGNRIRFDTYIFKTANGYSRSAVLGSRDVRIGDAIRVTFGSTTVDSIVSGLVADVDEATVAGDVAGGDATPDTGNAAEIVAASSNEDSPLPGKASMTVTLDETGFTGLAYGHPSETYILTVKTAGSGNKLPGTVFTVTANNGDDDGELTASAYGTAYEIGDQGATIEFGSGASETINVGDSMTVTFEAKNVVPTLEAAGTYIGAIDTTYIVEVVTGGIVGRGSLSGDITAVADNGSGAARITSASHGLVSGDKVTISGTTSYNGSALTITKITDDTFDIVTSYVADETGSWVEYVSTNSVTIKATTINGSDAMTTTAVTADAHNVIGTQGVTLQFQEDEDLVTGDKYLVAVTAAGLGAVRTLVLRDKLTGATDVSTLDVTLSLIDDIDLGDEWWTASTASIIVGGGATYTTAMYLGITTAHTLLSGDLYMEYRELLTADANKLLGLSNVLDVEDNLGPAVEDNPLSLMVKAALTPADGTLVYYIQLETDDLDGYETAAGIQDWRLEPYSLVPYSTEQDVCDALEASVEFSSAKERALYRQLIRGIDVPVYDSFYTIGNDENDLLATLIGTDLVCANAEFVAEGVRAGDKVHINYQPDNKGGTVYDTYVIDEVVSDTELTVTEAPAADIGIAIKMEVWRTATPNEYVASVGAVAQQHENRRVCALWSDSLAFGGETDVSKAVLAAYIAGLRSAVAPHQPLSHYELQNLDITTTITLGGTQLNNMAAQGVWIVHEDAAGDVYSRHQLTTDMQDVGHREQSVTTNADAIVRDFRDYVSDLYGRGNVSDEMLELIRSRLYSVKSLITARSFPPQIGPQLQDMTIEKLYKDPVNKDQIWCEVDLDLPEPLNILNIKFRIF